MKYNKQTNKQNKTNPIDTGESHKRDKIRFSDNRNAQGARFIS